MKRRIPLLCSGVFVQQSERRLLDALSKCPERCRRIPLQKEGTVETTGDKQSTK